MCRVGDRSPWGKIDYVKTVGEGVWSVSTAGHGGFKLSPERNAKVHPAWRHQSGWYEEDCDWAIVAVTFPDLFIPATVETAHATVKNVYPEKYEAAFGVKVDPSESSKLREKLFRESTQDKFVVFSAWGDWHDKVPSQMVGVVACIGGDHNTDSYFLVPLEEYRQRGEFSFVVDPSRHKTWTPPRHKTWVDHA